MELFFSKPFLQHILTPGACTPLIWGGWLCSVWFHGFSWIRIFKFFSIYITPLAPESFLAVANFSLIILFIRKGKNSSCKRPRKGISTTGVCKPCHRARCHQIDATEHIFNTNSLKITLWPCSVFSTNAIIDSWYTSVLLEMDLPRWSPESWIVIELTDYCNSQTGQSKKCLW